MREGSITPSLGLAGLIAEQISRALGFPHELFDGLDDFELAIGMHAELGELARTREHLVLERADGRIEGLDAARQGALDAAEMAREHRETLVQVFGERTDRLRVLGERGLTPPVRH